MTPHRSMSIERAAHTLLLDIAIFCEQDFQERAEIAPEVLLNVRIIKLTFITQNNYVYKYTAESLTPKVLLNVKSPY